MLFGALVWIARARSTPTDCGLALDIGRTYSVRNLADVIPLGPPQRSHHLRLQTRFWGPKMYKSHPYWLVQEWWTVVWQSTGSRADGAPMLGRAGPSTYGSAGSAKASRWGKRAYHLRIHIEGLCEKVNLTGNFRGSRHSNPAQSVRFRS